LFFRQYQTLNVNDDILLKLGILFQTMLGFLLNQSRR